MSHTAPTPCHPAAPASHADTACATTTPGKQTEVGAEDGRVVVVKLGRQAGAGGRDALPPVRVEAGAFEHERANVGGSAVGDHLLATLQARARRQGCASSAGRRAPPTHPK